MIQFEQGCVYDVAHLRPFNLELALQGHPLALRSGEQVRLFRDMNGFYFALDYWADDFGCWAHLEVRKKGIDDLLRLAPLAVKDGRPLHVEDEIETFYMTDHNAYDYEPNIMTFDRFKEVQTPLMWRWPVKKKE
jgi:hypothetical protein